MFRFPVNQAPKVFHFPVKGVSNPGSLVFRFPVIGVSFPGSDHLPSFHSAITGSIGRLSLDTWLQRNGVRVALLDSNFVTCASPQSTTKADFQRVGFCGPVPLSPISHACFLASSTTLNQSSSGSTETSSQLISELVRGCTLLQARNHVCMSSGWTVCRARCRPACRLATWTTGWLAVFQACRAPSWPYAQPCARQADR